MTSRVGRSPIIQCSRVILCLLCWIGPAAVATATSAQENALEAAASNIAQHLRHERVVVFGLIGPGAELTPMGKTLADDISVALARTNPKLRFVPRSGLGARAEKAGFTTEALVDRDSLFEVASSLKADVMVMGTLTTDGNELKIALTAKRIRGARMIDSEQATVPAPENRKSMQPYYESALGNAPEAGKNGYSYPRCVFCPQAPYPSNAVAAKTSGTVILAALITPQGRADEVKAIKTAPDGLTESAISVVRRWRLVPATGPDGNPATVRQIIVVTFHMN